MRHAPTIAALALLATSHAAADAQDQLYVGEYEFEDPKLKTMQLDGSGAGDLFDPGFVVPASDWLLVGLAADADTGKIYWLHGSTPGLIRRANLDGSDQELLVGGLKLPRGLALDPSAGKMYWSASPPAGNAGGVIQRANLDGTGVETVFTDPHYDPVSSKIGRPRVDAVNGWAYFATNDRIVRTNLDGPPFEVFTVVTGVSTARAVALDAGAGHIYWIGADTIEDVVCRANLDNTEFTVVYDLSPLSGGSSGLNDLVLDLASDTYFVCDDIDDVVSRGALDGSSLAPIYTPAAGSSPAAMTLDVTPSQPFVDCNSNGEPDGEDVISGASDDCNQNGVPDSCEDDPCAPVSYLLDQSAGVTSPGRQLGGAPMNQSWVVFQPFDVAAGGWDVGALELNGVTWTYRPEGFTATVFPDLGTDYPDEMQPLASGDAFFRFAPEWVEIPLEVSLPEGRHWVRLTANDANDYLASVSTVTEGLPSFSRSGLGNDFPNQPPIALRVVSGPPVVAVSDAAPAAPALRIVSPNPSRGSALVAITLDRGGRVDLGVYDVHGRRVRTLLARALPRGRHTARWDGRNADGLLAASGVYYYRMVLGEATVTQRVTMLR